MLNRHYFLFKLLFIDIFKLIKDKYTNLEVNKFNKKVIDEIMPEQLELPDLDRCAKTNTENFKKIIVICPVSDCKTKGEIVLPKTVIVNNDKLTTVNVPKDLVCQHPFQIFIDKQFKVRGYQKVDIDLNDKETNTKEMIEEINTNVRIAQLKIKKQEYDKKIKKVVQKIKIEEGKDKGYYLEKIQDLVNEILTIEQNIPEIKDFHLIQGEKREMTDEEIYKEFKEFIDDDNYLFKEYIKR